MRRLALFAIMMLSLIPLMAVGTNKPYYVSYAASYSVDLSDNDSYNGTTGDWIAGSSTTAANYTDSEMVGILGFYDTQYEKYLVSFNFAGANNWFFVSTENANFKIPFGLDLVVRHGPGSSTDNRTASIHTVGYKDANTSNEGEVAYTVEIDVSDTDWYGDYESAWIDIVMIVPQPSYGQTISGANYGSSNNYQSMFTITTTPYDEYGNLVSAAATSYTVVMHGHYNASGTASNDSVIFSITNMNSNQINLDNLDTNTGVQIGQYYYGTVSYTSRQGHDFALMVSSSRSPFTKGSAFRLIHDQAASTTTSSYVSFNFLIGLDSDHSIDTVWFDGTDYVNGDAPTKYVSQKEDVIPTRPGHGSTQYTYTDEGRILFNVPATEDLSNLIAGHYSSNIYIHMISL